MLPVINFQTTSYNKNQTGAVSPPLNANYTGYNTTVLVSPRWQSIQSEVGFVPTITALAQNSVTITDMNVAPNFFLEIFALRLNGSLCIGSLGAACGLVAKGTYTQNVAIPSYCFPDANPVIILTSYWQGSNQSVGYNEVVSSVTNTGFNIVSLNQASNYYVNYLAVQRGATTSPEGLQAEANSINKIAPGTFRIYFTKPFVNLPVVVLTPWAVGNAAVCKLPETVTNVTTTYFEITSNNYGPRYFVNWFAAAPAG